MHTPHQASQTCLFHTFHTWEELEKEYTFASDSDCEILLPMYEKYGTDMFAMLDAEYACVIYFTYVLSV